MEELVAYRREARLLDEWTDLQTLRSVHDALERRLDQASIARVLGISQPAVSKIAKRVRLSPEVLRRSPREVILERALGKVDDQAMLRELCTWPYADGRFGDVGSVEPKEPYRPGHLRPGRRRRRRRAAAARRVRGHHPGPGQVIGPGHCDDVARTG